MPNNKAKGLCCDGRSQAPDSPHLRHNFSPSLSDIWWQAKIWRFLWCNNCHGFRCFRASWKGVFFYHMSYIKYSVPRRVRSDKVVLGPFFSFMSSLCFIKKILEIGLWVLIYLLSQVLSFQNEITLAKSCKSGSQNISVVFGWGKKFKLTFLTDNCCFLK